MARILRNDPYLTREDTGADIGRTPAVQHYDRYVGSDGSSSNTVFTLSKPYVTGSNTLLVFVNGQKATLEASPADETEYEETSSSTVTFGASLLDTDVVEIMIVGTYFIQDTDIYVTKSLEKNANLIINGDMAIAQRGDSFAAAATGSYPVDRFKYVFIGTSVVTLSQETGDVPTFADAGRLAAASLKVDCTTLDAAMGAGDYANLQYQFEGLNMAPLIGKSVTLSFWIKATKTGTSCVAMKFTDEPASYVHEFTINASDTWEKKEVTIPISSTFTPTHDNTTLARIYFTLASGSTYQAATPDVWDLTGGATFFATSNQVNHVDSTDNNYSLAMVKLEIGEEATPFIDRPFGEELALCQRYFQKSYEQGTDPAANTAVGLKFFLSNNHTSSTYSVYYTVDFPVEMRDTPTVVTYALSGNSGKIDLDSGEFTPASVTESTSGIYVLGTDNVASTNRRLKLHYTADAEL